LGAKPIFTQEEEEEEEEKEEEIATGKGTPVLNLVDSL
jgi:hypothetical protein